MSLGWIIAGTIAELYLCFFLFMGVVFSACSFGGSRRWGRVHSAILNGCIYGLPATPVVSAGVVMYLYRHGAGAASYGWYAMPLAAMAVYLVYVIRLGSNQRAA